MTKNFITVFLIASAISANAAQATPIPFRADCRFHNTENHDLTDRDHDGPKFCYSSILYDVDSVTHAISDVTFGVGCDYQTIYNDTGVYHAESTIDRVSTSTSASPSVEIQPLKAMTLVGTYTSVLDVSFGRILGTCYVQSLGFAEK